MSAGMKLFCFGDSITHGESDGLRGGWADRVKTRYMRRFLDLDGEEVCVFNLGIGGEDTRSLRARFLPELAARLPEGERPTVILGYGANDAARREGASAVPVEAFIDNLRFCVDAARRKKGQVFLLTITPIAPAADGVPNERGTIRTNARIREYNDAIRIFALELEVRVLDVHAEFVERDLRTLFIADGVHPNAAGHAMIDRLVWTSLNS